MCFPQYEDSVDVVECTIAAHNLSTSVDVYVNVGENGRMYVVALNSSSQKTLFGLAKSGHTEQDYASEYDDDDIDGKNTFEISWNWTAEPVRARRQQNGAKSSGKNSTKEISLSRVRAEYHAKNSPTTFFLEGMKSEDDIARQSESSHEFIANGCHVNEKDEEYENRIEDEEVDCLPGIEIIAKLCETIAIASQHLAMGQDRAESIRIENARIKAGLTDTGVKQTKDGSMGENEKDGHDKMKKTDWLQTYDEGSDLHTQVAAVTALHLILSDRSPLTCTEDESIKDKLPRFDSFEYNDDDWAYALTDTPILSLSGDLHDPKSIQQYNPSGGPTKESLLHNLEWSVLRQDASYRIELLLPGYIALEPTCYLKARCAYVLGSYFLQSNQRSDWVLAEQILFECVCCLDRQDSESSEGILSDLGIDALVAFADVLCKNNKYKYGILAYEAAIIAYKLMTQSDFHTLTRKLCRVCMENRDWERAMKFHMQILNRSQKDKNVNEVVYVSEVVSMMQCDQGNFSRAEQYLRVASEFLIMHLNLDDQLVRGEGSVYEYDEMGRLVRVKKGKKRKTNKTNGRSETAGTNGEKKVDALERLQSMGVISNVGSGASRMSFHSHVFTLQLKLSQVYIAKAQFPQAIEMLQRLKKTPGLPFRQMNEVQMLLVRCFLRLRRFTDCEDMLNEIFDQTRYKMSKLNTTKVDLSNFQVSGLTKANQFCLKKIRRMIEDDSYLSSPRKTFQRSSSEKEKVKAQRMSLHKRIPELKSMGIESKNLSKLSQSEETLTPLPKFMPHSESINKKETRKSQKATRQSKHSHRRGNMSLGTEFIYDPTLGGDSARVVKSLQYMKLRARNLTYANRCDLALQWLDLALKVCQPSSLSGLGGLHYLRGKIYQRLNYNYETRRQVATGNPFFSSKNPMRHAGVGGGVGGRRRKSIYTGNEPFSEMIYVRGVDALMRASEYFRAVDDNHRQAKALSRVAAMHLHQLFIPTSLHGIAIEIVSADLVRGIKANRKCYAKERSSEEDENKNPFAWIDWEEFSSDPGGAILRAAEHPALVALDLASSIADPMLMLQCLINMAFLLCLQGHEKQAKAYWEEAYRLLTHIYLTNQLHTSSGVQNLPPEMASMQYKESSYLPSIPATQSRLPVSFISKLCGCAEALCQLMIGLGGKFLQGHASLFLSWHLLDTAKWIGESHLPLDSPLHSEYMNTGNKVSDVGGNASQTSMPVVPPKIGNVVNDKTVSGQQDFNGNSSLKTKKSFTFDGSTSISDVVSLTSDLNTTDRAYNAFDEYANSSYKRILNPQAALHDLNYDSKSERLWRHLYCIKMDVKKYSGGIITQPEVHRLNMNRVTDLLSEMKQGHYRRTSFHLAASQLADITRQMQSNEKHPYPPTTFFLVHVKHELIYFEPNTMSIRVWTPQQNKSAFGDASNDASGLSSDYVSSTKIKPGVHQHSLSTLSKGSEPHRDRSQVNELNMSESVPDLNSNSSFMTLDIPGRLRTSELLAFLNHNSLVQNTEVNDCEAGLQYLLLKFGAAKLFRIISVLLNEKPLVVVSTNPNRLFLCMSTLLSLLRPFHWQHLYIPLVPTSCANVIGSAINPNAPFLVGSDPVAAPVIVGQVKSQASNLHSMSEPPDITILQLDDLSGETSGQNIDFGSVIFEKETNFIKQGLQRMLPYSTSNEIALTMKKSGISSFASFENESEIASSKRIGHKSTGRSHMSQKVHKSGVIQVPTRYQNTIEWECDAVLEEERSINVVSTENQSKSLEKSERKITPQKARTYRRAASSQSSTNDVNFASSSLDKSSRSIHSATAAQNLNQLNSNALETSKSQAVISLSKSFQEALSSLFCEMFTMYPLFVRQGGSSDSSGPFDYHGFLEAVGSSVGFDCIPFLAMFLRTKMCNTFLSSRCKYCGAVSEAQKALHRPVDGTYNFAFEKRLRRSLNVIVAETGVVMDIPKKETLYVAVQDMSPPVSPKQLEDLERVPKLKERRRWVTLERNRLTYYQASTILGISKTKIKGAIELKPSETRICLSPPVPVRVDTADQSDDNASSSYIGTHVSGASPQRRVETGDISKTSQQALMEFGKKYTIKLENQSSNIIIYLRCPDEISFLSWCTAIKAHLMPLVMKERLKGHKRGSIR